MINSHWQCDSRSTDACHSGTMAYQCYRYVDTCTVLIQSITLKLFRSIPSDRSTGP